MTVNVLANDADPDGDAFDLVSVLDVVNGTATIGLDDRVTFVPAANHNGPASFRYEVRDGHGSSAVAKVTVSVTPVADPTVAVADTARAYVNGLADVDVVANDSDPDGPVQVLSVTDPPHGTSAVIGPNLVRYTPDLYYAGTDTFSYTVGDGTGPPATAAVTVTVSSKEIALPLSTWSFPGVSSLDGVGHWIVPANMPAATAGQRPANYRFSETFPFSDVATTATVSLGIEGGQTYAWFSITRHQVEVDTLRIPYPWTPGKAYLLLTAHVGGGRWQATVIDWATGAQTVVGALDAGPSCARSTP